jgi:tryptophanyl-tRNA synthetase
LRAEMIKLSNAQDHIDAVLADGARRASAIAHPVIEEVKEIVGLVRAR